MKGWLVEDVILSLSTELRADSQNLEVPSHLKAFRGLGDIQKESGKLSNKFLSVYWGLAAKEQRLPAVLPKP